jgi:hypothetical protein
MNRLSAALWVVPHLSAISKPDERATLVDTQALWIPRHALVIVNSHKTHWGFRKQATISPNRNSRML